MNDWKRKFIIIWMGQLFSILTSTVAQFAIILWISIETGSAEVLSLAAIAALLPQIVIGPFAGVYVDRWKRKRTMIGADSFVALCSAVMALLYYFDCMELWLVYLLLMLRSVGSAFHSPAMKSSVPMLAPESELTRIAGVNQAIQSVCTIAGPAIGAVLVVSFDMTFVMMLDVAGAAIACTSLLFVTIPDPPKVPGAASARNVLQDMYEGFRAIRRKRGLSWLMGTEVLISFFLMPVVVLIPLMTLQHFGGTPYQVGLIEMLFGAGSLGGGALLGMWNPRVRRVILVLWAYLLLGLSLVVSGLLPPAGFVWYGVLAALQGISVSLYTGPFTALLQTQIESSHLGRVFSLFESISLLPAVIGLTATGLAADSIGIPAMFLLGGVATSLVALVSFFMPSLRALERS